jgi:hypothetical protein
MSNSGVRLEGFLNFETGAYRLSKNITHFSLPAGWSCPFAGNCSTRVKNGKLEKYGSRFTCFAAVQEYDLTIASRRWQNFEALKGCSEDEMVEILMANVPTDKSPILVHYSGDFFSAEYFRAWMRLASLRPEQRFAAETTSIEYWVSNKHLVPENFHLVACIHSSQNKLIREHKLQYSAVVFSPQEMADFDLKPNTSYDSLLNENKDLNLGSLVCSLQQKGTEALTAAVSMKTGTLDTSLDEEYDPALASFSM